MSFRRLSGLAMIAISAATLFAAAGCGSSKKTTQPTPTGPPNPNSPVNAVLLLQYAMQHRDTTLYRTLFPDQYTFTFQAADTAATNHFSGTWGYGQERAFARHLFVDGTPGGAAASSITLAYSGILSDQAVPNANPTFHRMVSIAVVLTVQKTDNTSEQIVGGTTFFLVRGDSASLPQDLIAQGVTATSGRWFVERWLDQTGGVVPNLAARPARGGDVTLPTIGQLKVRYLPPFPAVPN